MFQQFGYGITDPDIVSNGKISQIEASQYLIEEIYKIHQILTKQLGQAYTSLNHNQKTALISLKFNLGTGNTTPKLFEALKKKDYKQAAEEFKNCNKAGGKVVNRIN